MNRWQEVVSTADEAKEAATVTKHSSNVSTEVDNLVDSRASSSCDVITFEGKPSATKVNDAQDDSILTSTTLSQTNSHAYSCVVSSPPNYSAS